MTRKRQESRSQFTQFMQPVLDALVALGGSGRPAEVKDWIASNCEFDQDMLDQLNQNGDTKFSNNVDWARFYLARAGYLDSSTRGVWALTAKAKSASIDGAKAREIQRAVGADSDGIPSSEPPGPDSVDTAGLPASESHRQGVLEIIRALSPKGFENLCRRILRESGFQSVDVLGGPNDQGIDGIGILEINAFVSFRVMFQCKRYTGSVGPDAVRDFRGAMQGRSDKGLIVTTGTFTRSASEEATRDGVPPIELVDGEGLVNLLEKLELGLSPVTVFEIDRKFFDQFADQP